MLVTELVVHPLKSPTVVKDEQSENIPHIDFTDTVSHPLKSRLIKDEQSSNIQLISVTSLVLKLLNSIVVKEE